MSLCSFSTVGSIIAFMLLIISMLNLCLYAVDIDGAETDCAGMEFDVEVRDRTGGIGLTVSGSSIFLSLACLIIYVAPALEFNKILKVIVIVVSAFMWMAWVIPWSLLGKDMSDYDDVMGDCDMPYTWSATMFFSLFEFCLWTLMLLLSVVSFFVNARISD